MHTTPTKSVKLIFANIYLFTEIIYESYSHLGQPEPFHYSIICDNKRNIDQL